MPKIKANKKYARKSAEKRLVNKARRSMMKTKVKKTLLTVAEGDKPTAVTELNQLYKLVDSLADKNLIHKNKAARIKSRMTKKVNKIGA